MRRRSSVEAPPPRFQLRKQNTDNNSPSTDGWITQRGTTDEIRQHLKHLGPSNLASRPRQTRYSTVKIKRSNTSPSRSAQTDFESGQSTSDSQPPPQAVGYQGGIGAGLLNSAGTDAKDGAHALKVGYGALASNDNISKSTTAQQYKDLPQVSIPEAVHEEHEDQPRSGSTRKAGSVSGSIHSTDSPAELSYQNPVPARSGSITEQIVDVNGIRKVVLHTNGTSSSEGEAQGPHHLRKSSGHSDGVLVGNDYKKPDHSDSNPSNSKKRRRRKKRGQQSKSTDDGPSEDQPLLQ
ncbi:hypothetical protein NUU61_002739 [Penicillium alfredii]|uniref:Uncharacterized protein n=1 Tax=Penicillium alfredii TaxID=1506179 RepID=A0A9W9KHJ0_9EURO|nr:uncharacterized protein NUU61_002739 [Penicillium alfredii]KAJ5105392.1 hypothetical protein NUU61_002739 [Penicillium alfredii]